MGNYMKLQCTHITKNDYDTFCSMMPFCSNTWHAHTFLGCSASFQVRNTSAALGSRPQIRMRRAISKSFLKSWGYPQSSSILDWDFP